MTQNGKAIVQIKSDRTQRVFEFIRDYKEKKGMAPTYREIGRGCNIPSTAIVRYHLDQLEINKKIKRYHNVPRGIVVL